MRFSVVVPVRNNSMGLRGLIPALLAQDYPADNFEIIVVDDGSDDESISVVEGFQSTSNIPFHLLEEPYARGSYAARNRGIAGARGDVIAFTDSDCIPASDWLRQGISHMNAIGSEVAAGQIRMTFGRERPNLWEHLDAARKLNQKEYVEQVGFGATANLFVRRHLFEEFGGFVDELYSGGDYEFGRRLSRNGRRITYAERAIVYHPARDTFRAVMKKSIRIARGQKRLEELGLLEHGRITWRRLLPTFYYPPLENSPSGVSRVIPVVLMLNLIRCVNLAIRV